jgi:hypothetical protein
MQPLSATSASGTNEDRPEAAKQQELIDLWDYAVMQAPDPKHPARFLEQQTGVNVGEIYRLQRVRDKCAHPQQLGWPSSKQFDQALATARELQRRLA